MEQPALKALKLLLLVLAVLVLSGGGAWLYLKQPKGESIDGLMIDDYGLPVFNDSAYDVRAPRDKRIIVEVLNATTKRGLARAVMLYLRDRGFDVVYIGNSSEKLDSTLVLNRSGSQELSALVGSAMRAQVESRPDSSRYVDVTVLVGNDWTPPPLPFNP